MTRLQVAYPTVSDVEVRLKNRRNGEGNREHEYMIRFSTKCGVCGRTDAGSHPQRTEKKKVNEMLFECRAQSPLSWSTTTSTSTSTY